MQSLTVSHLDQHNLLVNKNTKAKIRESLEADSTEKVNSSDKIEKLCLQSIIIKLIEKNEEKKLVKGGTNLINQEDESLLSIVEKKHKREEKITWNSIAQALKQKDPMFKKNGKQCRERWINQLCPDLKRDLKWTSEENDRLFATQAKLGNKWAEISEQLPGRTDNCIKNHFYSTLRKGMRKINSYIQAVKRQKIFVKTFKEDVFNKILALSEEKFHEKFQFTDRAKHLAAQVKAHLVKLALYHSQIDEDDLEYKEQIFENILEFTRNCRKRKPKKNTFESKNRSLEPNLKQMKQAEENQQLIRCEKIRKSEEYTPFSSILKPIKEKQLKGKQPYHAKKLDVQIIQSDRTNAGFQPFNSNITKSKNSLFGLNSNAEVSQDWQRSQNDQDIKDCGFINSVPIATKNAGCFSLCFEQESKKKDSCFSGFEHEAVGFDFSNIFQIKEQSNNDNMKSQQLARSFNFSMSPCTEGQGFQFSADFLKIRYRSPYAALLPCLETLHSAVGAKLIKNFDQRCLKTNKALTEIKQLSKIRKSNKLRTQIRTEVFNI